MVNFFKAIAICKYQGGEKKRKEKVKRGRKKKTAWSYDRWENEVNGVHKVGKSIRWIWYKIHKGLKIINIIIVIKIMIIIESICRIPRGRTQKEICVVFIICSRTYKVWIGLLS